MADGYVGKYHGIDVYYCKDEDYFADKQYFDHEDAMFILTKSNLLIKNGKVIGETVSGGNGKTVVNDPKSIDIYYYYPERKPVKTKPHTRPVQMLGNPTKNIKHTVTERRSVEWYMQHTIDILNEGVKYGEEALRRAAAAKHK